MGQARFALSPFLITDFAELSYGVVITANNGFLARNVLTKFSTAKNVYWAHDGIMYINSQL